MPISVSSTSLDSSKSSQSLGNMAGEADEELRQRIFSVQRKSLSGRVFYCPAEVKDILTLAVIVDYLRPLSEFQDSPLDVEVFATLIHSSAQLIFASLLADGHGPSVLSFVYRQYTDAQMPFAKTAVGFLSALEVDHFLKSQWEFRPMILGVTRIHQTIDDDWILPFLRRTELGSGASGIVSKVQIPTTCQDLIVSSDYEISVAVKVLRGGENGHVERATLNLVHALNHPNIIEFLGSYTYRGEFTLLFPAASMNLRAFLTNENRPKLSPRILHANLHGLADALARIHNFSFRDHGLDIVRVGYHHDLRPENILLLGDRFVICDFGLSRLKPDDKDSKTPLKGGHDDYLGPESFDYQELANGSVGRALDVWAFGCIMTELATLIYGRSVRQFREARRATHLGPMAQTDCAFHLNGQIRPAVQVWLDNLHDKAKYPLDELVDLAREMLNPNPHTRPKIGQVVPKLLLITIEAALAGVLGRFSLFHLNDQNDNTMVTPPSAFLGFLELERISAWHSVFTSLDQVTRVEWAPVALRALENLEQLVLSTDMARCAASGLPDEILDAVDAVCIALPETSRGYFNSAWTQRVCEIDKIEFLEAIRQAASKTDRYRSVGISSAMKYMSMVVSKAIRFGRSRLVDIGAIDIAHDLSTHVAATDRSKAMGYFTVDHDLSPWPVFIEWKEYDNRWQDRAQDLQLVMDGLVNLLDDQVTPRSGAAADRILRCLGYFHQQPKHRFGFLYALPACLHDQKETHVFSLHRVISFTSEAARAGEPPPVRPDLGKLFEVAKDLSCCIMSVHEAGWLHKNIMAHQVLVFSPTGDQGEVHRFIASTAVLSGFNDSRPEASSATLGPNESSWLYRHGAYEPGVMFRRSFDYYGLGLVLLEMGLWVTISELKAVDHHDLNMEQFRQTLLAEYVPQLCENMGGRYRDAVRFCLDAERIAVEMGIDVGNGSLMHKLFMERVIDTLAPCCA